LAIDLQRQKECIIDLVELLKPIEVKAKAKGNSLESLDLNWLKEHLCHKSCDSPFLGKMKAHLQNELILLGVHALLNKCKEITTFIKRSGAQSKLKVSLKQENETRWNSKLIMLMSFPVNFQEVIKILLIFDQAEFFFKFLMNRR